MTPETPNTELRNTEHRQNTVQSAIDTKNQIEEEGSSKLEATSAAEEKKQ